MHRRLGRERREGRIGGMDRVPQSPRGLVAPAVTACGRHGAPARGQDYGRSLQHRPVGQGHTPRSTLGGHLDRAHAETEFRSPFAGLIHEAVPHLAGAVAFGEAFIRPGLLDEGQSQVVLKELPLFLKGP